MKAKQIKASRRKYDETFKKEVLQMVESGRPVPDIARSLGVGGTSSIAGRAASKAKLLTSIKHPLQLLMQKSFRCKNASGNWSRSVTF